MDIIVYIVVAVIVDVLSLPFGIFGGKVGKDLEKDSACYMDRNNRRNNNRNIYYGFFFFLRSF